MLISEIMLCSRTDLHIYQFAQGNIYFQIVGHYGDTNIGRSPVGLESGSNWVGGGSGSYNEERSVMMGLGCTEGGGVVSTID